MTARTSFRDVKDEVLRRIRSNHWPPGAPVPGEVALAAEFGCSRATVNRAMRELSDEGILDRRRKSGTRVRPAPVRQIRFEIPLIRDEVEATGAAYRYALVSRAAVVAPDWLRARLALAPDTRLLHLHCMHYADGAPYQFEDRWISLAAIPAAEHTDFAATGPNEWLVREVPFTEAEIRFSATAADAALARFLQMPPGAPVFTADRTTWLAGDLVTNTRLSFAAGYQMIARY